MSRWFRFYDDAINDPKVLKLSDKLHRIWIGILCIASKNNGALPPLDDMALMIRMKPEKLHAAINELMNAGLVDQDEASLCPHNWSGRQFKSDVSTERVKRFRNGKRNVSETPPETESDTEERKKDKTALRAAGDDVSRETQAPNKYAFHGGIIRLTHKHFDQWAKTYANLNLRAELTARDAWLSSDRATAADRENWFISTSKYLTNRDMESRAKVTALRPEPQRGIAGII